MWKNKFNVCPYFQRCRASGDEAGLVHLHWSLRTLGALVMESSSHGHLPALYQGEEFGAAPRQNAARLTHVTSQIGVCSCLKTSFSLLRCQVSCMLGLFYLTSVAGLIATCAVLQQLSLSRYSQTEFPRPADVNLAHLQSTNLSPEAPPAAQHLPCCIMKNKSLNCQVRSPGTDSVQNPASAPSHASSLCVWGSLLASLGHVHPETNSKMEVKGAPTSKYCPGCLKSLPPLHCGLGNNSALPDLGSIGIYQRHALEKGLNSGLHMFPPVNPGACRPNYLLAIDKTQALLLPG